MLVDFPNVTNSLRDVSCKREGDFTALDRTRPRLRNLYRLAPRLARCSETS